MASDAENRDLTWLRQQFIIALASDDDLFDLLVLKGGNALCILHDVGQRASLDIDYSLEKDVETLEGFSARLRSALTRHFEIHDLMVFDWEFVPRPMKPGEGFDPSWGGYNAMFKVGVCQVSCRMISMNQATSFSTVMPRTRDGFSSTVVMGDQSRVWPVQRSGCWLRARS